MKKKPNIFEIINDAIDLYTKVKQMDEFKRLTQKTQEFLPEIEHIIRQTRTETREIISRSIPVTREPLCDIIDSDGETRVLIELPGVKVEDISITYRKPALIISAVDCYNRKIEGAFKLSNKDYDLDKATSTFKNGILEVVLPVKVLEFKEEDLDKEKGDFYE